MFVLFWLPVRFSRVWIGLSVATTIALVMHIVYRHTTESGYKYIFLWFVIKPTQVITFFDVYKPQAFEDFFSFIVWK